MSEVLSRVVDARARGDYPEARVLAQTAASEDAEPALLIELGRLEQEMGQFDASAVAFERALAVSHQPLRARAAAGLVRARRAQGRTSEAHDVAVAELARAPDSADLLTEAAEVAAELDDAALALTHLQRAISSAADDGQLATAIAALGNLHGLSGLYEDAERLLREALQLAEKMTGATSIEVSMILNDLGVALQFSDNADEVQRLFERSLAIVERAVGTDAAPAATLHHNLARVLRGQGELKAALQHSRRAVEIHTSTLGPDHLQTALDKTELAAIVEALGDLAEAEALLRDAVVALERELGPGRVVAVKLNNLGALVARRGDDAEAESLYLRSLAIKESILGPHSPALAATLNNLAVQLKRRGDVAEARALYERAIGTLDGIAEPDHPLLQSAHRNLATLVRDTSRQSTT